MDDLSLLGVSLGMQIIKGLVYFAVSFGLLRLWRRDVLGFNLSEWLAECRKSSPVAAGLFLGMVSCGYLIGFSNVIS